MDAAGTKLTRFGLLYKLLHQNEIVPFFMDEKRNVPYYISSFLKEFFLFFKKISKKNKKRG